MVGLTDRSLIHPSITDDDIVSGLAISKQHKGRDAFTTPCLAWEARREPEGFDIFICPVIGFSTLKIELAAA